MLNSVGLGCSSGAGISAAGTSATGAGASIVATSIAEDSATGVSTTGGTSISLIVAGTVGSARTASTPMTDCSWTEGKAALSGEVTRAG